MNSNIALGERYAGCLLGLACGDALGGPVEFRSRWEIARAYPGGLRDFVGGGWLGLEPGEVTDDTQMTLALAWACTADGLDMADVAASFLDWYRGNPKDIGNTTRAALANLAAGMPWEEAGAAVQRAAGPKGAAGNGSVMRCAPVALRLRRDPATMVRLSLDTARITHADPRCTWGAVAVNQAIVHLLNGGSLAGLPATATTGVDSPAVRDAVLGAATLPESEVRASGYVLHTVAAALWSLLRSASLEEAIVTAVSLGEDADTTGAVAGALAGAYYGAGAIPQRWLDHVQHRAELEELAGRLLRWSEQ